MNFQGFLKTDFSVNGGFSLNIIFNSSAKIACILTIFVLILYHGIFKSRKEKIMNLSQDYPVL